MRTILWFTAGFLLISSPLLAQANQATMAASPHKVKQGEQITIQVKVSPAPNVPGRVDVFIAPEGSASALASGGSGVGPGQTNAVEIAITLPFDAKLGNWKVARAMFSPANSSGRDLAISGNLGFEVIKRDTVLPTSADIEVK